MLEDPSPEELISRALGRAARDYELTIPPPEEGGERSMLWDACEKGYGHPASITYRALMSMFVMEGLYYQVRNDIAYLADAPRKDSR